MILEAFEMAVGLHGVQPRQHPSRAETQEIAVRRAAARDARRRMATQAAALQRAHDARLPRLRADGRISRLDVVDASALPAFSGVWAVAVCSATLPEITPPSSTIIAP